MKFAFTELTKKQQTALFKFAARTHKTANKSSNDNTVQQAVATKYGKNWLFTYYRTIDNLINDNWSIGISGISSMVVDKVLAEYPQMSNVTPVVVQNGDEYFVNDDFVQSEDAEGEE